MASILTTHSYDQLIMLLQEAKQLKFCLKTHNYILSQQIKRKKNYFSEITKLKRKIIMLRNMVNQQVSGVPDRLAIASEVPNIRLAKCMLPRKLGAIQTDRRKIIVCLVNIKIVSLVKIRTM